MCREFKFKLNFYEEKLAGLLYPAAKRGTSDRLVSDVFVKNMNLRNFSLSSQAKFIELSLNKKVSLCFITPHFLCVSTLSPITFLLYPKDPGPSYFSSKLNSVKALIVFSVLYIYLLISAFQVKTNAQSG